MVVVKLKEDHPTSVKVNKLTDLANELGITLSCRRDGQLIVNDKNFPDVDFEYRDDEQSLWSSETTGVFPYPFEVKLIKEYDGTN